MIKEFLRQLFRKRKQLPVIETTHNEKNQEKEIVATGGRCEAVGADARILPAGLCKHAGKRFVKKEYLDGLPIPERAWTHCIFCKKPDVCYFAGDCEDKLKIKGYRYGDDPELHETLPDYDECIAVVYEDGSTRGYDYFGGEFIRPRG